LGVSVDMEVSFIVRIEASPIGGSVNEATI